MYSSVSIRPSFHRNESKIDTVENRLEILESNYLEWKSRMISNKIPVDGERGYPRMGRRKRFFDEEEERRDGQIKLIVLRYNPVVPMDA